jgi:hypothetical protein
MIGENNAIGSETQPLHLYARLLFLDAFLSFFTIFFQQQQQQQQQGIILLTYD